MVQVEQLGIKNLEALALDFYGVLADSRGMHTQARMEVFNEYAQETGDERYTTIPEQFHEEAHLHGQNSVEIIGWVLYKAGIVRSPKDHDQAMPLVERKQDRFAELIKGGGLPAMLGAKDFVHDFFRRYSLDPAMPQTREVDLLIVAPAYRWEIIPFLKTHNLEHYFLPQNIITREDTYKKQKSYPELFRVAFDDRLGIPRKNGLAVEDSPKGIRSARRAGVKVVAIATTHSEEELNALSGYQAPNLVVPNFRQLEQVLGFVAAKKK